MSWVALCLTAQIVFPNDLDLSTHALIERHQSGEILAVRLAEPLQIQGAQWAADEVGFHPNGRLWWGTLATDSVIQSLPLSRGKRVWFYDNGLVDQGHARHSFERFGVRILGGTRFWLHANGRVRMAAVPKLREPSGDPNDALQPHWEAQWASIPSPYGSHRYRLAAGLEPPAALPPPSRDPWWILNLVSGLTSDLSQIEVGVDENERGLPALTLASSDLDPAYHQAHNIVLYQTTTRLDIQGHSVPEASLVYLDSAGQLHGLLPGGHIRIGRHVFPAGSEIVYERSDYFTVCAPRDIWVDGMWLTGSRSGCGFHGGSNHSFQAHGIPSFVRLVQPAERHGLMWERILSFHANGHVREGTTATPIVLRGATTRGRVRVRFQETGAIESISCISWECDHPGAWLVGPADLPERLSLIDLNEEREIVASYDHDAAQAELRRRNREVF